MPMDEKMIRKLMDGREYRRIDVSGIELRDEGNGQMIVEGYATTFGQFYELWRSKWYVVNEQVDARSFDECDMSDVIFQYDHKGRVMARTRNHTLEVTPDQHGLKIRANLGGTELGRQLYEEIKGGYTNKMSFGFTVSKQERTEELVEGKTIVHRKITGIKKLYDVSAVSLPANDATEISARNFSEGVIAEIEKELLAVKARQRKIQKIRIMMEV